MGVTTTADQASGTTRTVVGSLAMFAKQQIGATLIEGMCTLAILSLTAGIAAPHLQDWHQRTVANGLISSLTTDIALARMTAISRGKPAVICATADAARCQPQANWNDGWVVFLDENRDRILQATETVLSVAQARPMASLTMTSTAGRRAIRLFPDGMAYGSNVTVTACLDGMTHARIIMNNAGRVRTERPAGQIPCKNAAPVP